MLRSRRVPLIVVVWCLACLSGLLWGGDRLTERHSELLDTDGVSTAWSQLANAPAAGQSQSEQAALDTYALQSFRQKYESGMNQVRSSLARRSLAHKARKAKRSGSYYEPALPNSATQGWSDLLSRVTRELASDTFDVQEMKATFSTPTHNACPCRSLYP